MFTDAKTVMINGNEVKSIQIVDGGYLYRKLEDGSHNYRLDLVSNKNSVNYGVTDTVTLTATLTDNNRAVSGEWVSFYKDSPSVVDGLVNDTGDLIVLTDEPYVPIWSDEGVRISEDCDVYYNQLLNFVDDEIVIEFDCSVGSEESNYYLASQFGMNNRSSNYEGQFFIRIDGSYDLFNSSGTISSNLLTDVLHIRLEVKNGEQKFYVNGTLISTWNQTFTEDIYYGTYYRSNNYFHFFSTMYNQDTIIKNLLITINGDGEILGASQTNNNGVASLNYSGINTIDFVIYAMFSGVSDSVSLSILHNS